MISDTPSPRNRRVGGVIFLVAGLAVISISTGLIKVDESTILAPRWVLFLFGLLFVSAGLMVMVGHDSRALDLLAAVFVLSMGGMAAWAALASPPAEYSGGFLLLSSEVNVGIGRIIFGLGAILCFVTAVLVVRRGLQRNA